MQYHSFFPRASLLLFVLLASLTDLHAQESNPGGRLSFLSAADKRHLLKVRREVLTSQPDLKAEQDSLDKERKYVRDKGADATAEDKSTLRENLLAHSEKMQAAMEQADPSVSPIVDQIKTHWKDRLQASQENGEADASQ